jgi:hypothetical protein
MQQTLVIDGQRIQVTHCPTAYAAPTRGGSIPPAERKALAAHVAKFIEEDPRAWMRNYAVKAAE